MNKNSSRLTLDVKMTFGELAIGDEFYLGSSSTIKWKKTSDEFNGKKSSGEYKQVGGRGHTGVCANWFSVTPANKANAVDAES